MSKGYIYLASPYSTDDVVLRAKRAYLVSKVGYKLTEAGMNVFCPVTMSHNVQLSADEHNRVLTHEEWMRVDYSFLQYAEGLYVLMLDGWDVSRGVKEEIEYAVEHNIPITYLNDDGSLNKPLNFAEQMNSEMYSKGDKLRKKDLTEKQTHGTVIPGVKDTLGKSPLALIPYAALEAIARVREFGNRKYQDPSKWYQHDDMLPQFVEAAQRHLAKYQDAVMYGNRSVDDEESGLSHLDHAICTLALAIALRDKPKGDK